MLKIEGLDELQKKLGEIAKKADALDGEHNIPVAELLTDSFVSQHTSFSSAKEMFKASGFKVENQEDFSTIPDVDWDNYIRSISNFDDWQNMLVAAGQEWTKRQLGL